MVGFGNAALCDVALRDGPVAVCWALDMLAVIRATMA